MARKRTTRAWMIITFSVPFKTFKNNKTKNTLFHETC